MAPADSTALDVTKFSGKWANVSYGPPLIATGTAPNVMWQTTSSNATYASASNIITTDGKTLKRQAIYR